MSAFKAQAHMRELVQRLKLSIADAVIDQSQDVDGMPAIRVEKDSDAVCLKIKMDGSAGRVDGLGLPQRAYSPHIVEMLQDSDSVTSAELKLRMHAAAAKLGMKILAWEVLAEDMPASAQDFQAMDLVADATKIAELPSDEINPLIQSQ